MDKTVDMFNEREILLKEAKDQVLAELHARATELSKTGYDHIPGGICGVVHSSSNPEPQPTGLYSDERGAEIVAKSFRIMLLAYEGIDPYEPSNGTEGEIFMEKFCFKCSKDPFDPETGEGTPCPILGDTMLFNAGDAKYPREWRRDGPAGPRCTAFEAKESEN